MDQHGYTETTREVAATQIPSGIETTLPAGTPVQLTQSLGGTFTVHAIGGMGLFRIKGDDADALGLDKPEAHKMVEGPYDEAKVWEQLRNCYDPEIPVNIVDLGLVYSMDVEKTVSPAPESGIGYRVNVTMTLTAPGCGMGPAIAEDAKSKILLVPGVSDADVRITWEPPWNQQMISEEGKMKLGLI